VHALLYWLNVSCFSIPDGASVSLFRSITNLAIAAELFRYLIFSLLLG
jgi:hypothetical protein